MGLDMYLMTNSRPLTKDLFANHPEWNDWKNLREHNGIVLQWRKANMIHKWFVDNVQNHNDNCGIYEVSVDTLRELLGACRKVLASTELVDGNVCDYETYDGGKMVKHMTDGKVLADPTVAMKVLPTQDGFFFGSTDYDEGYWSDVKYTADMLQELLDNIKPVDFHSYIHRYEPDWHVTFYYESSW